MAQFDMNTRAASSVGPALRVAPVTPSDSADLPLGVARSLFVGVAGDVAVVDAQGGEAIIISAAHQYHPIFVRRVKAEGTTALGILALY
jgi:hypothetical protein